MVPKREVSKVDIIINDTPLSLNSELACIGTQIKRMLKFHMKTTNEGEKTKTRFSSYN